jgi:hypothetical protein
MDFIPEREDDIDKDIFEDTLKDFYTRCAEHNGIKIEDYMIKQLQICGQYIERELQLLIKYSDNIMKKIDIFNKTNSKSYEYECIVLTIKELYDRVKHQFDEYYELNHTYKLYTYRGQYKSFVYVYDKLILSHKTQFDSYVKTINHFIVNLD